MSRGERRLSLELSGGRPASSWPRERLVELVGLERWRSWLVVWLIATALGPLLLRPPRWHLPKEDLPPSPSTLVLEGLLID